MCSKWEAESEADDRALEAYDKVMLERQGAKIDAEIAEKDRLREEIFKLLTGHVWSFLQMSECQA